jgi:type 2 lantibiotic biosynthesis protein LanM
MQQLDIPFFTHRIDGDALELDAEGSELPGFIQTSGLQAARERLRALDHNEIDFQLSLIRGACQARQLRVSSAANASDGRAETEDIHRTITDVEAATRIGEQLLAMAIHDQRGQMEWLGMDLGADGESFSFGPVGTSLYGGSIGIACLLRQLEAQCVRLAGAAEARAAILKPLHDLAEQPSADGRRRWWRDQPLGLSGCGGVLLALQQLDEQPLAEALLADALPRFIAADQQLDLIGGCAGLIGALLQLNTPAAVQLAAQAGHHLVAQQDESGAWNARPRQPGLLGLSHGTAGYAAALAQLHASTGEEAFARAARAALSHERSRFDASQGNWPDLRQANSSSSAASFMVSWCHGAPGIGLGRACLWGTDLWDEQCAEEISVALATTTTKTTLGSDHLCCGSLGLMVVLRTLGSGPWPLNPELREHAAAVANAHSNQARQRCTGPRLELRCFGTQEGILLLPGFFTGLSGMALALLTDSFSKSLTVNLLSAGLCGGTEFE